jgi:dihydroorotate dehydrogenase
VRQSLEIPEGPHELSITNSFGMPSMSPQYLQLDIAKARHSLQPGQLLIVSVVGSPGFSQDLAQDFVRTALIAKEAGAQVIEANFSCPNVSSKEGCLYVDSENSFTIAQKIVKAIAPLPLMIKVGAYSNTEQLRNVLHALAKAGVRAVCGINSLSRRVIDADGNPALSLGRETSGICGEMIRPAAIGFLKDARKIIDQDKLDLELAGCGGVTSPAHFDELLQAGAKVVLAATGMMWNPYLAAQWHHMQKENG